ncbi:MAG TPA: 23S rRNA (adenine(2503)-C(2))-methyltransferase RlmN [Phycisphaerales bacterium]|nr:23S rRNA (adenine(2503)-C(2))-methyltransferase RlmN [Phycisphaerales bacterium]
MAGGYDRMLRLMDKDLKNKTLSELEQITAKFGVKPYIAKYIFTFIHQKDAADINSLTTLSKDLRASLTEAGYFISQLKIVEKLSDPDGTEKYLFQTADGQNIESVLLDERERKTICLSTQIGCRLGCKFCATGYLKFKRSLTAGEIIDQVNTISKDAKCKINNIVFMGMGEPFENYDETLKAVRILAHPFGKNIGIRRQTISTVGIPAGIKKLADEDIHPRLAVSLHAPDDELRKQIVPAANKYPMSEILNALKLYNQKTSRRITIEYCLIDGINDSSECAKKLAAILSPLDTSINLIEYNPHPGCDFAPANREKIRLFKDILTQRGFETIIRFRRGTSIKAACGQLGADRLKEK